MVSRALQWIISLSAASFTCVSAAYCQKATDFKEGLGYYFKTEGKLFFLDRTTPVALLDLEAILNSVGMPYVSGKVPGILGVIKRFGVDVPREIGTMDVSELKAQIHRVKKDVKFYSYGPDFSRLESLAFCYISQDQKCERLKAVFSANSNTCYSPNGPRPIRLYPIRSSGAPIHELVIPRLADDFASGNTPHAMWLINTEFNCNNGWLFQFPTSITIDSPTISPGLDNPPPGGIPDEAPGRPAMAPAPRGAPPSDSQSPPVAADPRRPPPPKDLDPRDSD
jgi:hypothetical protein